MPKENKFLERSQASDYFSFRYEQLLLKTGMKNWWNNNDRGQQNYQKKNLSQCYFIRQQSHMYRVFWNLIRTRI